MLFVDIITPLFWVDDVKNFVFLLNVNIYMLLFICYQYCVVVYQYYLKQVHPDCQALIYSFCSIVTWYTLRKLL